MCLDLGIFLVLQNLKQNFDIDFRAVYIQLKPEGLMLQLECFVEYLRSLIGYFQHSLVETKGGFLSLSYFEFLLGDG